MDKAKVCIIDYGSGNVTSVFNIFRCICQSTVISNDARDVEGATHLVLPGVGAFGAAMDKVRGLSVFALLNECVLEKKRPFLGICVGMQILADEGHEYGCHKGLGWIPGSVDRMASGELILPHVGWNNLKIMRPSPILDGIEEHLDFYYVHSYSFGAARREDIVATCEYGGDFAAVINRGNIFGVQFHPEKSQKAGKRLIKNFLGLR